MCVSCEMFNNKTTKMLNGFVSSTDVDECETKPCPAYSICENAIGGFNCTCKEGYSGKSCSGMILIYST